MNEERKATMFDLLRFFKGHNCLNGNDEKCKECGFSYYNINGTKYCGDFMFQHFDKANEIVLKWCDEHPIKTRQSEFLKLFPNAETDTSGVIMIAPCGVNRTLYDVDGYYDKCKRAIEYGSCEKCRKEYWNEEV